MDASRCRLLLFRSTTLFFVIREHPYSIDRILPDFLTCDCRYDSITSVLKRVCYIQPIDIFLRPKRTRLMSKPKVITDTVKVSRLGCMRKSTVVRTDDDKTVEHVEVWVPADKDKKKEKTPL